jgi:hypothetical protein
VVVTRPFTEVETTPHAGQPELDPSAVSTCTTRPPNATPSTRRTTTPGNPNNNVVA